VEKELHFFLTSTLAGGEWSASHPSHLTPGKRAPGIHLVDLRFGLGAWRKRKKSASYGELNCGFLMDPACSVVTVPTELSCCYRHVCYFLIMKPTRCTSFSNLFWKWHSACFGHFLCPSSGVIHCTLSSGICHAGL